MGKLAATSLIYLFIAGSCAPAYLALLGQKESATTLPSEVDRGDRFADPNLVEQEKASGVDTSTDSSYAIDAAPQLTGPIEEQRIQINQRILKNADYVVKKESNKSGVGDACNFFLQRVLELSGFSDAGYVANNFDQYAKKRFTGFKTAQFRVEPLRKDEKKLQQFLFSYPEGTPIILQWKKAVGHGHLAIVTRKDNQLIIYEASLGRFNAQKKLTNARTILSASENYQMIAYVNFMPSDK